MPLAVNFYYLHDTKWAWQVIFWLRERCTVLFRCSVSVCLQILNSFNISGMDEATLFKFDKWVEYGRVSPAAGVKNFPRKGRSLGHVTLLKIMNPINISGMDEATLVKFGKWIDYIKSHPRGNRPPPRKERGLGHVIVFEILNPLQHFSKGWGYAV